MKSKVCACLLSLMTFFNPVFAERFSLPKLSDLKLDTLSQWWLVFSKRDFKKLYILTNLFGRPFELYEKFFDLPSDEDFLESVSKTREVLYQILGEEFKKSVAEETSVGGKKFYTHSHFFVVPISEDFDLSDIDEFSEQTYFPNVVYHKPTVKVELPMRAGCVEKGLPHIIDDGLKFMASYKVCFSEKEFDGHKVLYDENAFNWFMVKLVMEIIVDTEEAPKETKPPILPACDSSSSAEQ